MNPHIRTLLLLVIGCALPLALATTLWYQVYSQHVTHSAECQHYDKEGTCIEQRWGEQGLSHLVAHEPTLVSDMTSGWQQLYAGGATLDQTVLVTGSSSLLVSAAPGADWSGAVFRLTDPEDWSDSDVRIYVRVSTWDALTSLLLLIETGSPDEYFTFNFRNFFAHPPANEWIEVVLPKSAFEASAGEPSWTNVTGVGVRVIASDAPVHVWFDDLIRYPRAEQAVVSITFDDGFADTIYGARMMSGYGFTGTNFVIPELINEPGFLTDQDLNTLHDLGWDTSGHGFTDLRSVSGGERQTELRLIKTYITSRGYRGAHLFAYPNGSYDQEVRAQVAEHFNAARTINGFMQPQGYITLDAINGMTISNITPTETIFEWIDVAIDEGSWLILTWHKLTDDDPVDDIEYRRSDFLRVLSYLHSKNVEVAPVSEVLDRLIQN